MCEGKAYDASNENVKICLCELENHLFSFFEHIDFDSRTSHSNHYRLIEKPRLTLRIIQCESWTIFNGGLDMPNCTRGSNLWSSVCLLHMWLVSCQGQTLWLREEEFSAVYWDAMEDIFHFILPCCFRSPFLSPLIFLFLPLSLLWGHDEENSRPLRAEPCGLLRLCGDTRIKKRVYLSQAFDFECFCHTALLISFCLLWPQYWLYWCCGTFVCLCCVWP